MESEIRYVNNDGAPLGYSVFSEGSGKPPAIFAHGYSGRSTGMVAYRKLLTALAAEFTVYALDLRGHGASASIVEGFTLQAAADDVAAFAGELNITGALYIGHSYGGFAGMHCEARNPGTFSALGLLTPGAARGAGPGFEAMYVEHGKNRDFLMAAIGPGYKNQEDAVSHVEAIMVMDPRVHQAFFPQFEKSDILEDIRSIQIPVLFLNGAKDMVVSIERLHETAMAIPNCKEIIYTTQGHNLPVDFPDLTAREIIAFWKHDVNDTFAPASA